MCDFSLNAVKSRPASVGDKLETHNFGSGTIGFKAAGDTAEWANEVTAVCVLPGTEIAFDKPFESPRYILESKKHSTVAIFRQINKDNTHAHHDALETPQGEVVLLTTLQPGQAATVLQLPAAPKTEQEVKDQTRVDVVA